MTSKRHAYRAQIVWDGNLGEGTATYSGYGRQHRIVIEGKPELHASSDPMFRGDPAKHNPEDLFLGAVSSCHMLSYLALCARESISVVAYRDEAAGTMVFDGGGGGRFEEIRLHPIVTLANAGDSERALALHERAHALCYIASSCSVPIHHDAEVRT